MLVCVHKWYEYNLTYNITSFACMITERGMKSVSSSTTRVRLSCFICLKSNESPLVYIVHIDSEQGHFADWWTQTVSEGLSQIDNVRIFKRILGICGMKKKHAETETLVQLAAQCKDNTG